MNNVLILDKEHPEIPNYWTIKITYWDKTEEAFEIVNQNISNGVFSFWTKDNKHYWRMQDKIKSVDFDDNFTKYIELEKKVKEAQNGIIR